VTNMAGMFWGASAFNQNIGNWNVGALINANRMFSGVTLSIPNYDALLSGWDAQALQPNVSFDGGNSKYCASESARTHMIHSDLWTITDGGKGWCIWLPIVLKSGTVVGTGVQIVHIFYDGLQDPNEPDEYIEIRNFDATPVDLTDWFIYAEYYGGIFIFPDFTIQPGQSCRVYTNQIQSDSCVQASFLNTEEIWNNAGDCGYLYDLDLEERSSLCYGDVQ
jgi:hypothetical protein